LVDQKEAKRRFRQIVVSMGIYRIRNRVDGKAFIGIGRSFPGKLNSEKFQLDNGLHPNKRLQEDYTRVGGEHFVFEILDELNPAPEATADIAGDLATLEGMWLEKLQPYGDQGYNQRKKEG
jgi:hypothetical protein